VTIVESDGVVMSQERPFNEFEDRAIVDYKRFRGQVEHENELVHHRMTWLLTSNAFLFAAFAAALSAISMSSVEPQLVRLAKWLFTIIPVLGLFICYIASRVIDSAFLQIKMLIQWWEASIKGEDRNRHPPLIELKGIGYHRLLLAWGVPSLLSIAWIGILIGFHQLFLQRILPEILMPALGAALALGVFVAGWYSRGRYSLRAKSTMRPPNSGPQPDDTASAVPRG
jgi:hypothetical protein